MPNDALPSSHDSQRTLSPSAYTGAGRGAALQRQAGIPLQRTNHIRRAGRARQPATATAAAARPLTPVPAAVPRQAPARTWALAQQQGPARAQAPTALVPPPPSSLAQFPRTQALLHPLEHGPDAVHQAHYLLPDDANQTVVRLSEKPVDQGGNTQIFLGLDQNNHQSVWRKNLLKSARFDGTDPMHWTDGRAPLLRELMTLERVKSPLFPSRLHVVAHRNENGVEHHVFTQVPLFAADFESMAYHLRPDRIDGRPISLAHHKAASAGIRRLALAAFSQLALLHRHNIVHRDPSLRNLFYDPATGPILADFGLADFLDEHHEAEAIGIPVFQAPECLEPTGRASPASDVFFLSASLLYLLNDSRTSRPNGYQRLPWFAEDAATKRRGIALLQQAARIDARQATSPELYEACAHLWSMRQIDAGLTEFLLEHGLAAEPTQRESAAFFARTFQNEMPRGSAARAFGDDALKSALTRLYAADPSRNFAARFDALQRRSPVLSVTDPSEHRSVA